MGRTTRSLAGNSSPYLTSEGIDALSPLEHVVNTHFYVPPERNAVDIMSCRRTDEAVNELLMKTAPGFGLVHFRVRRETVGFIYNRIWAAIKLEALAVVAEGVALHLGGAWFAPPVLWAGGKRPFAMRARPLSCRWLFDASPLSRA